MISTLTLDNLDFDAARLGIMTIKEGGNLVRNASHEVENIVDGLGGALKSSFLSNVPGVIKITDVVEDAVDDTSKFVGYC